jgi:hypothetical protein
LYGGSQIINSTITVVSKLKLLIESEEEFDRVMKMDDELLSLVVW